jgi:hypothetical protein
MTVAWIKHENTRRTGNKYSTKDTKEHTTTVPDWNKNYIIFIGDARLHIILQLVKFQNIVT